MNTVNNDTEALFLANKEIGLEVNDEKVVIRSWLVIRMYNNITR